MNGIQPSHASLPTILYLAAASQQLDFGAEVRAIRAELAVKLGGRIQFESEFAVSAGHVLGVLRRHKPIIVHFSGHGESEGLLFQDGDRVVLVNPDNMAELFGGRRICCVVLSACYSHMQAEAISKYVDVVIGIAGALSDTAAAAFATQFYSALVDGATVRDAAGDAKLAIPVEGLEPIELVVHSRDELAQEVTLEDMIADRQATPAICVLGLYSTQSSTSDAVSGEICGIRSNLSRRQPAFFIEEFDLGLSELYSTIWSTRPDLIHVRLGVTVGCDGFMLSDGPLPISDFFGLMRRARGHVECIVICAALDLQAIEDANPPADIVILLDPESNHEEFMHEFYLARGLRSHADGAFQEALRVVGGSHRAARGRGHTIGLSREVHTQGAGEILYIMMNVPAERFNPRADRSLEISCIRRTLRLTRGDLTLTSMWNAGPEDVRLALPQCKPSLIFVSGLCEPAGGFVTSKISSGGRSMLDARYFAGVLSASNSRPDCVVLLSENTDDFAAALSEADIPAVGFNENQLPMEAVLAYLEGFLLSYGTRGAVFAAHKLGRLFARVKCGVDLKINPYP